MKEENDFRQPSLLDEEANEFKLVYRSSYLKKAWELLKQSMSGIKNTVSLVFHNFPLTIKSLTLVLILSLFFSLVSVVLLKENRPFGYDVTDVVKEAIPKKLTMTNLLEAHKSEPFCEAVENCFNTAIEEFRSEPQIVKENAKMILECNGTRKEFVSGKGENYIEVFWVDGQAHYTVKEANSQAYVARLRRQPLPLNLGSLLNVYQQLASFEGSEELCQCLNKAIEEFPKEPHPLQDNAVLQILCGGSNVTFRSEPGKNEINVYKNMQGEILFNVQSRGWAQFVRFFVKH